MGLLVADGIHPTALIDEEAEIAGDVRIGPYSIIEGRVSIGPGCVIEGHVSLSGPLRMGSNNFVGHGSVLGKKPQSRTYNDEPTSLTIGCNNVFREYVTIHRGTIEGGGETRIGDNNMLMISAHLGHDVQVGDNCTLVNNTLVAGHVVVGDSAILSGHSVVQQRVRIGRLAMLGGQGGTTKDIPPFVLQQGYNCVTGLNLIGMRRSGMPARSIDAIRCAFRIVFKEGRPLHEAIEQIENDLVGIPEVDEFVQFVKQTRTGINQARDFNRQHWTADLD